MIFYQCRPKDSETSGEETSVPVLAPPPRPQALPESPRLNPFDKSSFEVQQRVEPQYGQCLTAKTVMPYLVTSHF